MTSYFGYDRGAIKPSTLNKVATGASSNNDPDLFEEGIVGCCFCGDYEDVVANTNDLGPLPSSDKLARVLGKVLDAPGEGNGDPLDFAVHALVPLQQITKWSSTDIVEDDQMAIFLTNMQQMGGIAIILRFMVNHINDQASVLCSVRALQALLLQAVVDVKNDDWEKTETRLSKAKTALAVQFLKEKGLETVTRAFGLHALNNQTQDSYYTEEDKSFSLPELRMKTVDILTAVTPQTTSDKAAKLLQFLCRVIPQMLSSGSNDNELAPKKMNMFASSKEKTITTKLMQKSVLCIQKTIDVKGINRKLSMDDVVEVVNVSVSIMKACPKDEKITTSTRALWSWAAKF